MQTECNPEQFDFGMVEGREVVAAFDASLVTSDAGAATASGTTAGNGQAGRRARGLLRDDWDRPFLCDGHLLQERAGRPIDRSATPNSGSARKHQEAGKLAMVLSKKTQANRQRSPTEMQRGRAYSDRNRQSRSRAKGSRVGDDRDASPPWDVCRQPVQVAAPARSRESLSSTSAQYRHTARAASSAAVW